MTHKKLLLASLAFGLLLVVMSMTFLISQPTTTVAQENDGGPQWQYRVVQIFVEEINFEQYAVGMFLNGELQELEPSTTLQQQLNVFGRGGWQLIHKEDNTYIFMRPA